MAKPTGVCANCGEITPVAQMKARMCLPCVEVREKAFHLYRRIGPVRDRRVNPFPRWEPESGSETDATRLARKAKEDALPPGRPWPRPAGASVRDQKIVGQELKRRNRRKKVEQGYPVPAKAKKKSNKKKLPTALAPHETTPDPISRIDAPVKPGAEFCNSCSQRVNADGSCGC